jgi:iron(III) transport system permease protein
LLRLIPSRSMTKRGYVSNSSRRTPGRAGVTRPNTEASLRGRYLLAGTLAALVVLVLFPWGFLIWSSLVAESPSGGVQGLTLHYFARALLAPGRAQLFGVTFLFSAGTAIVATVLGTLLAWLVERTDAPGARAAYALSYVFFAVPGLLKATGWILLFNDRTGFLWVLLRRFLHVGWTFPLYSLGGMIWSQALLWLPVVFLFLGTSFRNMDDSLEDAARTSRANRWRTFAAITLRLARPALWAVVLLSFIESLTTLETPLFIGMPGAVYTVTSEIYRTVTASLVPDYGTASALAVVLMAAVAVAIYGYQRALHSGASYQTVSGKGFRARHHPLGRHRWLGGLVGGGGVNQPLTSHRQRRRQHPSEARRRYMGRRAIQRRECSAAHGWACRDSCRSLRAGSGPW